MKGTTIRNHHNFITCTSRICYWPDSNHRLYFAFSNSSRQMEGNFIFMHITVCYTLFVKYLTWIRIYLPIWKSCLITSVFGTRITVNDNSSKTTIKIIDSKAHQCVHLDCIRSRVIYTVTRNCSKSRCIKDFNPTLQWINHKYREKLSKIEELPTTVDIW